METPTESNNEDIAAIKEMRKQLETRIETQHLIQQQRIASLQTIVPDLVSTLDLSLRVVSAFNGLHYTPTPIPPPTLQLPIPTPNPNPNLETNTTLQSPKPETITRRVQNTKPISKTPPKPTPESNMKILDGSGSPLSIVRSMVAVCLLERVPFSAMDSRAVLRKLESDQNATAEEKAALLELGGESGGILAVEMALRSMGEDKSGVELEEYLVSGKSRVLVLAIDRNRLVKELPESSQLEMNSGDESNQNQLQQQTDNSNNNNNNVVGFGMGGGGGGGGMMRPPDMWGDPHMSGMQPMFPPGMMFPRGGHRGMGMAGNMRGMAGGVPPLHRPPMGMSGTMGGGNSPNVKQRTEEDDMKDLEALLSKKSFREMQKSKTGKELLDLINRPTAKETAVTAKFKSKGGSQVKEYCTALTKDDCRRQSGSYVACGKVHFRRIIALHTDINLGDCSFLDTCRHMKTCKYVHYELDSSQDVPPMMMGGDSLGPPKPIKTQRAEYCSEVELGESQWINCDIRSFRMDILGQFGVIMADPPWDIHMELPYGTMADDEMRTLNVPALQTDGLIFLWVTGRAMELGRECLELWGYKRIEELIWVKTNQLQRIIRTGRTGHWLNHSKEHCLVGIKGNPEVNRNIDTDVLVAEVRETSRKPDEMYPLLERISPRTRKLELFARMHNTHAGWISLGNQLSGVRLVDEGLRARFKAAYPEVEVQPSSPPRASAMEIDSNTAQTRSPFTGMESKPAGSQFAEPAAPQPYASEEKPMTTDIKMPGSIFLSSLYAVD